MTRVRRLASAVVLGVTVSALVITWAQWRAWKKEGAALAKTHQVMNTPHPGFSFPSHVFTAAVPLDGGFTPRRLIAEAKLRSYTESCLKTPDAGTFCEKRGSVVPRSGDALEPVELGLLLGRDQELRTHLPLRDAPKALIDAIIVSEDRDFRKHGGVNFAALGRAVFANAKDKQYSQGASTLTMQVVRSLTQQTEKTVARKLREMGLARGLDEALGKDGVLQLYIDAPYLGQRHGVSVCGFAEASKHYFDVDIRRASLAQVATLVAILPAPGKLGPDRNPTASKARRDTVLRLLEKHAGYDVKAALAEPMKVVPFRELPDEKFPAYFSAVRQDLEARLPPSVVYGAGLRVETGLDLLMQTEAETIFPAKTALYEGLVGTKKPNVLQGVGIALDVETGLVRALYGGRGLDASGFNRATQAHRQPGSSFKPLVYALAFSQTSADGGVKYTAGSTQPNAPRDFKTPGGIWRPYNVGGEFTTTASLAQGLTWSQNIATASLLEELGGPAPLIAFAKRAGFNTALFPNELGLALGQAEVTPLEMAQFAGEVANGGRALHATPVLRAVDVLGHEWLSPPRAGEAVMSPEAAALTRDLMRLVIEYGTGGATRGVTGEVGYPGPAIGKTGTTDSERDLWFVGATPKTAAVVWLGYDQPSRLGASAADFAAPLWGWWLGRSTRFDASPLPDFSKEPKLVKQAICTESGLLPNPSCKVLPAPFRPGTTPKGTCAIDHTTEDAGVSATAHESLWKRRERLANEADAGFAP